MNRKQYFAVSWFFLALMVFLIFQHIIFWQSLYSSPGMNAEGLSPSEVYFSVKWAIVAGMIMLSFPLFVLFQILGWLEPKKK